MSDVVQVALINGIVTISALTISRFLSRQEHLATQGQISEMANGLVADAVANERQRQTDKGNPPV